MTLDELKNDLLNCRICEEKFGYEPHPVFQGNENSKIVHISQAPSANVHKVRRSFSDKSGEKLKYEWYQITDEVFYNPDNFYIASIARCYPGKSKHGGDNPPPKICAEKWLDREIEFVNNKIYLLVGALAAKHFFPNEKFDDLVFNDNYINGKLAMVLPHPSPLNIKWFMDHPKFESERIIQVRNVIKKILSM
jgi:uracil-DNA glycosylase family 4